MDCCVSGETLLKKGGLGTSLPVCLLGEHFYIQLFVDFNLFENSRIYICNVDKNYWSCDVDICYLNEKDLQKGGFYTIYCGFDVRKYIDRSININCDFFDMTSVRYNGTFEYNGKKYIVDDVKYVASDAEYMKRAYPKISKDRFRYLQELSRAPAGRRVEKNGQICLFDYQSEFINQIDGRRVTLNAPRAPEKRVHIFGDSRVSGYMIEDQDLFSNILQDLFNDNNQNYEVINYGIPGREIDRIQYQVEHALIDNDDIVFVMTGCYEYRAEAHERQLQFARHMKNINEKCLSVGAKLIYINLPVTVEMTPESDDERVITDLYRHYKFKEYSLDTVKKYKIFLLMTLESYGVRCYDMAISFNDSREELLFINMHHYSPAGNRIIAEVLYNLCKIIYTKVNISQSCNMYKDAKKNNARYVNSQLRQYSLFRKTKINLGGVNNIRTRAGLFRLWIWIHGIVRELKRKKESKNICGAIVMNANPFTLGHRYLVEFAAKMVDYLYIFVLTEEKSEFSYDDRLKMVYYGCKDIKNLTVTSGGDDVISNETFPEYFMKNELQNSEIVAYKDIERFGTVVAPRWTITKRFVGEEPLDKVTKQYNEQMKKYLPRFGIEVCEIPRLTTVDNISISASKVRALLKTKNWEIIKTLVPKSTYVFLKKKYDVLN